MGLVLQAKLIKNGKKCKAKQVVFVFIVSQVVKVTGVGAAVVLPPQIRLAGREYNSRPNVSLAT